MSRVLCRRGVARGAMSRGFTAEHLLEALKGDQADHVYMELDNDGMVTAHGGRGAAALAAAARLAPSAPAAAALLTLVPHPAPSAPTPAPAALLTLVPHPAPSAPTPAPAALLTLAPRPALLALRLAAPLPPHAELLVWFADDALAALDMPFVTLRNIGARRDYTCHRCGAAFDDPNPLKVHLFLSCAPYERRAFWARAASRLQSAAPAPAPAPAGGPAPAPDPAALEALATAWGRARGGHVCVFCGKLYSRRYGLKIHLRTHTGYRPLHCRYCLRAFGDPSNLNKHVRLHSRGVVSARDAGGAGAAREASGAGAARLACGVCGRGAARRRDLERHMRTHMRSTAP